MYKIDENSFNEKYILLIPAMLDAHFPLLKYAFYSEKYHPVILENEENITDIGLRYVNNDMCYPSILNVGQLISALQSGKYDLSRTRLLMPAAGDACRGSGYIGILRKAVKKAGFEQVKVISLNLKGIERENRFSLNLDMIKRALFGIFYGDILMLLVNQCRPYEINRGDSEKMRQKWIDKLSADLRNGSHLSIHAMKENFRRISADFASISRSDTKKKRVGIVGELYTKYCHLGNWNIIDFLEKQGCETHTNGLSWYALYYIDSHLSDTNKPEAQAYKIAKKFFASIQNAMITAMREQNFYTCEPFSILKKEAADYVSFHDCIGDGWLIGAEIAGYLLHGCDKVVAVQPFGCMVNHICGRGIYSAIQRKIGHGNVVSADVDSSGSPVNVYNRIRMLIDLD